MRVSDASIARRIVWAANNRVPVLRISVPARWANILIAAGARPAVGCGQGERAARDDRAGPRSAKLGVFQPAQPDFDWSREELRKRIAELSPAVDEAIGTPIDNYIDVLTDQWIGALNNEFEAYRRDMHYLTYASIERARIAATAQRAAEMHLADTQRDRSATLGLPKRRAERRYRREYAKDAQLRARLASADADVDHFKNLLSIAYQVLENSTLRIAAHGEELKIFARLELAKRLRDPLATEVYLMEPDQADITSAGSDGPAAE
jgi:hypothetical protein